MLKELLQQQLAGAAKDLLLNDPAVRHQLDASLTAVVHDRGEGSAVSLYDMPDRFGNHMACVRYRKLGNDCPAGCVNKGCKDGKVASMLTYADVEHFRAGNVQLADLYKTTTRGAVVTTDLMQARMHCSDCVPAGVCVKTSSSTNRVCAVCGCSRSKGCLSGRLVDGLWVCCPTPISAESSAPDTEAFLAKFVRPLAALARARGLTLDAEYKKNGPPGIEVDFPVVVKRDGKVLAVAAVELDNLYHAGYEAGDEHVRVRDTLDGYQALHGRDVRVMVVHFDMTVAEPNPPGAPPPLQRWLVLRQWLADHIMWHGEYPDKCALYLNYPVGHANVWPGGPCGVTVCAPRDIQSVGLRPTRPDWASSVDMREAMEVKELAPERSVIRDRHFAGGAGKMTRPL